MCTKSASSPAKPTSQQKHFFNTSILLYTFPPNFSLPNELNIYIRFTTGKTKIVNELMTNKNFNVYIILWTRHTQWLDEVILQIQKTSGTHTHLLTYLPVRAVLCSAAKYASLRQVAARREREREN